MSHALLAWGFSLLPYIFVVGLTLLCVAGSIAALYIRRKPSFALLGPLAGAAVWTAVFTLWTSGLGVEREYVFSVSRVDFDTVARAVGPRSRFLDETAQQRYYEFDRDSGKFLVVPTSYIATGADLPDHFNVTVRYIYDWGDLRAWSITEIAGTPRRITESDPPTILLQDLPKP